MCYLSDAYDDLKESMVDFFRARNIEDFTDGFLSMMWNGLILVFVLLANILWWIGGWSFVIIYALGMLMLQVFDNIYKRD